MAVKKTQQKAKKNWGWPVEEEQTSKKTTTKKTTKKQQQKQQKEMKKRIKFFGVKGIATIVLLIVLFAGIGVGGGFFLTRNDCFEIVGQDEIELEAKEKYFDEGVKVVEFGKDKSDKVEIETDLKINSDGSFSPQTDNDGNPILKTYYIIYKVDTIKLSKLAKIERIRLISFVEDSEGESVEDTAENVQNNGAMG